VGCILDVGSWESRSFCCELLQLVTAQLNPPPREYRIKAIIQPQKTMTTATNPTTGKALSRCKIILDHFPDLDPKIREEIYDAFIRAKAEGQTQAEVFETFATKYNQSAELKAQIQKVMDEN
jgi:hypothetical protein